ncbi:prolyl oligopeptidase family serine peptidase [Actinoplanes derwentensis]|uniref:Dipeptidyl-peptidase-4 n=1 Tax=Actinoplanes derwentensis TaxID=113562 RepID=A0A1H2D1T1_9ACTN|nr:prolyl oligopeptidase family serine peptidase [Actinoplanes derwentensis]GID86823.1 peptidase [Actinoplanes derwentensis]SDT76701.1 dipeptidyl-peptidase-4 [Actinoplanes derwentensis]
MEYPNDVTVGADSARAVFLRSSELWLLDLAGGVERRVADGVDSYATDRDARVVALIRDGELFRADLIDGTLGRVATSGPAHDARPDPQGLAIGYLTDPGEAASLRVAGPDGDRLLAGEPGNAWREHGDTIAWGIPGAGASEFGRTRGWWWSPDGRQILAVRSARSISLHLLDLDEGWVDVHWDRETYPHLAQVRWSGGGPLITVLRRMQQHGLILSIDPRTGETQVHAELADARWVEPIPGTPRHLPDGRVLVGGELAHDGFDARCLFADGSLLTPPGLYVRRVTGTLPRAGGPAGSPDLIVEGSLGEPAVREVFRVRTALSGGGPEIQRIATLTGSDQVTVGGDVLVAGTRVWHGERELTLRAPASPPPSGNEAILERVTDRRLPAGVLYPAGHVVGTRLPVLVTMGDGPGRQQVLADPSAWASRRWWADSGFAVVSIDSRGTPGVSPSFEKAVHRRLADVVLADQADALHALHGKHPDLDLSRVSVRGQGLGGWLAAMAVLKRPEVFHRAVAHQPVVDWADVPATVAERHLGDRADSPDVYAHHGLAEAGVSTDVLLVGAELAGFPSRRAVTCEEELTFLNG